MPDLSAAAAHLRRAVNVLRERAKWKRNEADQWVLIGNRATADSLRDRAAEDDAVAVLLEAIAEWREHGYQGYATENELADAAGAVAAVVVPTTERSE